MEIEFQLTSESIPEKISPPQSLGATGAWLEFRGVVRSEENGQHISALEYEAYLEMAEREVRRLLTEISAKHPCLAAKVIHRTGVIPVGDTAIYVGVASSHRAEGIALLAEFMDRLKQDVPIWKRRGIALGARLCAEHQPQQPQKVQRAAAGSATTAAPLSLDDALAKIQSRCQSLPAVRVPLAEAFGRVLRETVCAPEDMPPFDRSTRDGYAVLRDDTSEHFQVVDTLHAADWKPRQLKTGEAVRVATGAALPGEKLRVVMQENVERTGDKIRIVRHETARNVSVRGEDLRAGEQLLQVGAKLDAGALALLATAGNANPLVSPRLRVLHFTTGDEIIPPGQTPKPGQIRDSNSFLIHGLLQKFPCDVTHQHLPEDFDQAKRLISTFSLQPSAFSLVLVSGGASVGEKDFTRPLLEWLGFEIVFSQINVRPGRPLIFGVRAAREDTRPTIAFGLPGNPLSHFVCFHLFVAAALAKLVGEGPKTFQHGRLAAKLDDSPNPRETLWPARVAQAFEPAGSGGFPAAGNTGPGCPVNPQTGMSALRPLKWASSGDVTCLAETNALIRVPANRGSIEAGAEVDFLPTDF